MSLDTGTGGTTTSAGGGAVTCHAAVALTAPARAMLPPMTITLPAEDSRASFSLTNHVHPAAATPVAPAVGAARKAASLSDGAGAGPSPTC